jgi:hypothetical protein
VRSFSCRFVTNLSEAGRPDRPVRRGQSAEPRSLTIAEDGAPRGAPKAPRDGAPSSRMVEH